MSAPDTDLDQQWTSHRFAILGMSAGILFVLCAGLAALVAPGIPLDRQAAPDGPVIAIGRTAR
jgi:hypothetical protein